jgi:hypothetical protein
MSREENFATWAGGPARHFFFWRAGKAGTVARPTKIEKNRRAYFLAIEAVLNSPLI